MRFCRNVGLCGIFLFLQACQITPQQISGTRNAALYNTQLGLVYFAQGDRVRAKRKLLIALKQDPQSVNAHAAMAFYLEKTGDKQLAESFYQQAVALSSGDGAQMNNYGAFLCRQKRYHSAEQYFLLAVKDKQYIHTAAAYENAGLCAETLSDYSKARYYFNKALEQEPLRKQSLYELLLIDVTLKQYKQAMTKINAHQDLILKDPALFALAEQISKAYKKAEI